MMTNDDATQMTRFVRFRKGLGGVRWIFFAFICFLVFTFFKLPETKLKNLIHGHLTGALGAQGISLSAKEIDLSIGFGITYEMRGVTIYMRNSSEPMRIDELSVSPSFLSILTGKLGGTAYLGHGDGSMDLSFTFKDPEYSLSFDIDDLNIGKMKLLSGLAKIKGTGKISGTGSISGNTRNPQKTNGEIHLKIDQLVIFDQVAYGFTLPQVNISSVQADIIAKDGKARIQTLRLGKKGNKKDDIHADIKGVVTLNPRFSSSKLNLKTNLAFSEKVKTSFFLIDALLGSGKKADGSYSFDLKGTISSPVTNPGS